jgi:hypothetical protein
MVIYVNIKNKNSITSYIAFDSVFLKKKLLVICVTIVLHLPNGSNWQAYMLEKCSVLFDYSRLKWLVWLPRHLPLFQMPIAT